MRLNHYARNGIMGIMSQKASIEHVEVRGAAPFLGICEDAEGGRVPVWSRNPDVVMRWLCDAWRCRFNQLRTRRMRWDRDRETLVPLGDAVDGRTDRQVRAECSWLASVPAMILQSPNRIENTEWWAAVKRRKTLKKKHRYPGRMPRFKKRGADPMFVCWHNKGANALFRQYNRHHGAVVIKGQNPKEHSLPGQGCRFEIHIRVRLSEPVRPYTSVGVHPEAGFLVFVNDPLPIRRERTGRETGVDRGCVHNMALADGTFLDLPKERLKRIDREIRRRQRAQARRVKAAGMTPMQYVRGGRQSGHYRREQERIRGLYKQARHIVDDFQHKTTTSLVRDYDMITLEDLNLTGMSRKAMPVPDPLRPGRFLPNGQAAKRGLNKALRDACMGGVKQKLEYKTLRAYASTLVLVDPAYTSQRCSRCGHTCKENRESQAAFHCKRCGLMLNADVNAAINILHRGRLQPTGVDDAGRNITVQDDATRNSGTAATVSRKPTAQHQ